MSPFPGPDEELASLDKTGADDKIAFAISNGAAFVESNMGSLRAFGGSDEPKLVWKSSAAVAEYFRTFVMEMYGCSRPYGYVYGGSGGGYKTMACIENTKAWDGAVPYVIGSPVSLPNTITMHSQGQRRLRHVFGKIVDALDPGGSGDMYQGLNEKEAEALKELTLMGFPPKAWFAESYGLIDPGALPVLSPGVKAKDPEYFSEFWEKPGYLGADRNSQESKDRLVFKTTVKEVCLPEDLKKHAVLEGRNGVDDAWKKQLTEGAGAWIEVEELPKGEDLYLEGVSVELETGQAKGKSMLLDRIIPKTGEKGGFLTIKSVYGKQTMEELAEQIRPGDTLRLDNSDFIAIQSYYRHQVPPDLSFHAWDQFRDENGQPTLPQRENVMGYGYTGTGTVQNGNIQGKVIVIQSLTDESTCPWCGDWYRKKVIESKGNETDFRIYYMENCMHGDVSWLENHRVTNYIGALQQALLDVSDWAERGKEPLPSTAYTYQEGQILVPEEANMRKGIQPVVQLLANGKDCVSIKAGDTVDFTVLATVPKGAGKVTSVSYAFEEVRKLPLANAFPEKGRFQETYRNGTYGAEARISHRFDEAGTHFVTVRVMSGRSNQQDSVFAQVRNLARVRVIVE